MTHRLFTLLSLLLLIFGTVGSLAGCATPSSTDASESSTGPTRSTRASNSGDSSSTRTKTATPPMSWIERRVDGARERLTDSEAGRILWQSIRAHGGLADWYANGPLYFRYRYRPLDDGTSRDTYQTVDTWSARARHQIADNRDREYGWDGDRAWYHPSNWDPPYDVRFWALTPYYFVGMPFVLADPGVNLSYEGEAKLDGTPCDVVRATFGDVGISPDDYYVLYIGRDDRMLHALRYIVSYPEYFPEGGHSPETLMTYDGQQTIGGIVFAESYRFYKWDADKKTDAEKVTRATLTNVEFRPETPNEYFEQPADAVVP